jgi:flagellar motor switch/type III secretory pathway protein FliN
MDAAAQPAKDTLSIPTVPGVEAKKDVAENFGWLPCQLSLEVPVVKFTVGDLLRLGKESSVETDSHSSSDIPLRANGLLIAWTEFEVMGNRLAVRITEMA